MTTTTYPALDEKIAATLVEAEVTWKAYATGPFRKTFFIRFGTPASYSRTSVRRIAEAIFEKSEARPLLEAIRRDDRVKGPWVPAGQFQGIQTAGDHFGISSN
jgi:hypothetical protein